jgi:peptidoglycan/LPS O-acetylase OafA/YrhL
VIKLGHRASLDGLRGISILAVMAFHSGAQVIKGGHLGVDMFFVLSGFLITMLLLEEWRDTGAISLKHFYLRRALRLLPALVTVLITCGVFAGALWPSDPSTIVPRGILYTLFYSSNWYQAFNGMGTLGPLSHTWSLSIEEQFYIIWPPLIAVLLRLKCKRSYIGALLFLSIIAVVLNRARLWHGEETFSRSYAGLDTHTDGILIGCLVAFLAASSLLPTIRPRASYPLTVTALLILAAMGLGSSNHSAFLFFGGFTIFAVAVAVLIILLLTSAPTWLKPVFETPALVWVGRLSYGLYLWHIPIYAFLAARVRDYPIALRLVAEFGVTFSVASMSYYIIEKPFLRMKQGFRGAKPETATPAPSAA